MSKLVFVVGAGRSGSTLFMNMMNQHSSVIAPPEHDFLLNGIHRYRGKEYLSEKDITNWVRDLWIRKTEFKEIWKLDKIQLLDQLLKGDKSFVSVFKTIVSAYDTSKPTAQIVMDKNPFYTANIDLLRKRFPDALFVCIVRDYRDRYVSILRNESKVFKNEILRTAIWNSYNLSILKLKKDNSDITQIIKFEDLVANPEETIGEVCKFLNIGYEPSMMEYHKVKRMQFTSAGVLNDAVNKMHEGSNQPINKTKVGHWKNKLKTEELKELSFFCEEAAKLLGYSDLIDLSVEEKAKIEKKYWFRLIKEKSLFKLKKLSYKIPWWIQKRLAIWYRKSLTNN